MATETRIIEKADAPRIKWLTGRNLFILGLVLFACAVYREVFLPGNILFTTDDNIGALALRKRLLPHGMFAGWDDSILAGEAAPLNLTFTNVLLWILPVRVFINWIHAIDLILASLFFALFLRERGLRWMSCAIGCLTAFWLGSTFFLTYAGHIGKFGVVMFASLSLWLIEKAVARRSVAWAGLAGGAMGTMFLEQADVALFFALPLGFYVLFSAARAYGRQWAPFARVVAPLVVLAGLLAFRPVWEGYSVYGFDSSEGSIGEDPQANWDYCTQWSWPPEETIDFIAPGYTGWRSGEQTGPYWGRMGRSAEWESTRQGFMNFKLETFYLGGIPMLLALFALFVAFQRRRDRDFERSEVVFWGATALITFLLALGKFFPLYRLFYMLPGVSSIRNPVKFMQTTQLALAVLAAYGMEFALRWNDGVKRGGPSRSFRGFQRGALIVGGILVLWFAVIAVGQDGQIRALASQGWGNMADVIVANKIRAMGHAAAMVFAGWALIAAMLRKPGLAGRIAVLLVAIVCVDQLFVSRHYVSAVKSRGYIDENNVVAVLKQRLGDQRAVLLSQDGFYNQWLSVLFPYHGISTFNVAQMRMPADYKRYLGAVGRTPKNLWRQFAVGKLLGPGSAWTELNRNPVLKCDYEMIHAYNVGAVDGGVAVFQATQQQPGQHVVIAQNSPAPRYAVIGAWEGAEDAEILTRLASPSYELFQTALLSPEDAEALPVEPGASGINGSVRVDRYRPGRMDLVVSADAPAVLRVSEKYNRNWKATVGGKAAKVMRCDFLFQGVFVPKGIHPVVLRYAPDRKPLMVQLFGAALCLVALGTIMTKRQPADH